MKEKAVLLIGAAGALGNLICKEITEKYQHVWYLYIGDYKSERGEHLAKYYQARRTFNSKILFSNKYSVC